MSGIGLASGLGHGSRVAADAGPPNFLGYIAQHSDIVWSDFVQHLEISALALAVAIAIALPLGIAVARVQRLYVPVMGVLGTIYTIPSLSLLALLVPFVGIGLAPALIALIVYAQFILVRNIVTGLRGIDPAVIEAARGMGMSPWQVLTKVELPLALPVIVAGVRVATISIIGIATVAAYVAAGGLGGILFQGVSQNYNEEIEAGAAAISALAILADILLRILERLATRAAGRSPALATAGR